MADGDAQRWAIDDVVLDRLHRALPGWRGLTAADLDADAPKGFSSVTFGIRAPAPRDPLAVLYRQLEGKENAILDAATERSTFLFLGEAGIAARCLHYADDFRIEEFYRGRTLTADDVFDPDIQRRVAAELHRLHRLEPPDLPEATFFELMVDRWRPLVRRTLAADRSDFPSDERRLFDELEEMLSDATRTKVLRCVPDREPVFCHNDTYHGNVFLLDDGDVRLLDFEFSCRNHAAFDVANFFAETVMEHGLEEPPHFRIGRPRFTDDDLAQFVGFYVDHGGVIDPAERDAEVERLVGETRSALMLSDYMYAMAAVPLALNPIQRIRFIPYAHQRFEKFLRTWDETYGSPAR